VTFTLNQITQRAGGGDIVRRKAIAAAEPVIGRGADCDIQLPDLAVGLRHAVLRQVGRGKVEARSIGRQVFEANGSFTTRAQLLLADRPRLVFGSHELSLSQGDAPDEVVVTVAKLESSVPSGAGDEKSVFSLANLLFGRRRSAWVLAILLLLIGLAAPISYFYAGFALAPARAPIPRPDLQWESGALSPGHRFLENNCQACHQKAFVAVRDDACLACHQAGLNGASKRKLDVRLRALGSPLVPSAAADHAPSGRLERARPAPADGKSAPLTFLFDHPNERCESCHTEHVGPDRAPSAKTATAVLSNQVREIDCAGCHRDLTRRLADTALRDVASWSEHPDFEPLVTQMPRGNRVRVALTAREHSGLIFPHDLHLSKTGGVARMAQEFRGEHGYGAALDCKDCHQPDENGRSFRPIEMVRDCSACHSLAYARRGGQTMTLPHGDPKGVVAKLSQFYASDRTTAFDSELLRRRPGFEMEAPPPAKDMVSRAIRSVVAKGGTCYGCHTLVTFTNPDAPGFDVLPVKLTARYFPRGGFDHGVEAHRVDANGNPSCASCHKAVSSHLSSDLLLPPIARCAACHGQAKLAAPQPAGDSCNECHGYHNAGMPAVRTSISWSAIGPTVQ